MSSITPERVRHCQDCKKPLPFTQSIRERADGSKTIIRLPGKARCPECEVRHLRTYNRRYKQTQRKRQREKGVE